MRERCTSVRSSWPFPDQSSLWCATSLPSSTSEFNKKNILNIMIALAQWFVRNTLRLEYFSINSFIFCFFTLLLTSVPLFSLSQYSDENMMDPYNLAICFGPTLMPTPDSQDQVSCQAHVNEIIKTIIIHHETIFPDVKELDGPIYEKCMAGGDYW